MRRVLTVVLLLAPLWAFGGRRALVIGYDEPAVPDGDVEIETWLDYVLNPTATSQWRWWLGPRWSPHERIEVAALTSLAQNYDQTGPDNTAQLWAQLFEVRFRALEGRAGVLTLQLVFRLGLAADLPHQIAPTVGWAKHVGRFNLAAQGGYAAGVGHSVYHWVVWNAGASIEAIQGDVSPLLQFGVEGFGEIVLAGHNDMTGGLTTANVGPTVSLSRGRLWFTLGGLFGLTHDSPLMFVRGVVAVAL
jgi:hypothetical protein